MGPLLPPFIPFKDLLYKFRIHSRQPWTVSSKYSRRPSSCTDCACDHGLITMMLRHDVGWYTVGPARWISKNNSHVNLPILFCWIAMIFLQQWSVKSEQSLGFFEKHIGKPKSSNFSISWFIIQCSIDWSPFKSQFQQDLAPSFPICVHYVSNMGNMFPKKNSIYSGFSHQPPPIYECLP